MNMELFKTLKENWDKDGHRRYHDRDYHQNYLHPSGSFKRKVDLLTPLLSLFQDRIVVDIGSNVGIITYEIAWYAKKYIGVEIWDDAYKQSLFVQKYIEKEGVFLNQSMEEFLSKNEYDYNAAYAGNVLYYFTDKEVKLMEDVMLPKCKIVIFLSCEEKKYETEVEPPIRNDLYNTESLKDILKKSGFSVEVIATKEVPLNAVVGKRN